MRKIVQTVYRSTFPYIPDYILKSSGPRKRFLYLIYFSFQIVL